MSRARLLAGLLLVALPASAQPVATLSLRDAESPGAAKIIRKFWQDNTPRRPASELTREAAANFPTVYGRS